MLNVKQRASHFGGLLDLRPVAIGFLVDGRLFYQQAVIGAKAKPLGAHIIEFMPAYYIFGQPTGGGNLNNFGRVGVVARP